jgi:hypothetical protein
MLPFAADLSTPSHPSNCEDAMIVRVVDDCGGNCVVEKLNSCWLKRKEEGALLYQL